MTYRAAVIGLGRIASLLEDDPLREKPCTHAGALVATGVCEIAAGMDIDQERRTIFADRWGATPFDDAEAMIRSVRPEILVVATHPDTHEQYVRLAAQESVPVVVCEKPLAHTVRSARRIAKMERSGVVRVVVNHERRFSRDYRLVRAAVDAEQLGALLGVYGTLYFGRTAPHDRVLLHDGTHLVDSIHFLTDDEIVLRGRTGEPRGNRSSLFLQGTLKKREIPVTIEVGSERDYLHLEIVLSFVAGRIRVGNGVFEWERSVESPHYKGYRSLQSVQRTVPEPTGYFRSMMDEAVRLAGDSTARSESRAEDAYAVMKVIGSALTRAGLF